MGEDVLVEGRRWVEVDLDRIGRNVRRLLRFLHPTPLLVIVKADAYGHGMLPVARRALAAGASMLGVTDVEEGRWLRREGILAPVLLLQPPLPGEMAGAVMENLRITVVDRDGAAAVAAAARRYGRTAIVHLKVDTGMGRFGTSVEEASDLVRYVAELPGVLLEGVYSHFACADEPDHPETERQLARFRAVMEACGPVLGAEGDAAAGSRGPIFHLANSAGAFFFPESRLHMCRVGLATYGIYPGSGVARLGWPLLEPALSFKSRLVSVRDVPAGFAVGYGGTYRTARATRIGVVSAGYANGVPRALSNRGRVLVRGRSVPIVGRVCMHQTLVDLGWGAAEPGDEVVFIGRQGEAEVPVLEWCRLLDALPHDVLCMVGRGRPRVYQS